ncbi:MAG: prolyl-tRNA synthetase associated domain-containing protein [Brucellaceae bacterium]|nr:prolyl-tRNA synthetase associated domain-containing protein [Brucellaceae bacterium]
MPKTRNDLFQLLDKLQIAVTTVDHPPLFTVQESQALRGTIPGAHTKNLFLKDKKGRYFLLTVAEDAEVDLKSVHKVIGASGRVSFGSSERLMELLGVSPGSVTVFGLINDDDGAVTIVLDATLMENATINAHPLSNDATTSIARDDLLRFIRETGHEPLILNLAG